MNRLLALAIPLAFIAQTALGQNATDVQAPSNTTQPVDQSLPIFGAKEEPIWVDTELSAPSLSAKQIERWGNLTSDCKILQTNTLARKYSSC